MTASYLASGGTEPANDPRAWRMAGFAFLTHNLMVGTVFGSYGVLIAAVEAKLHVSRNLSSLGIPLIMLAIALGAPVVGGLLGRRSLRLLMMVGALLMTGGFALLAVAPGFGFFLLAYALFLGPAMALNATFIPTALVTRWFNTKRGRALGFVNMPLLAAAMPPLLALLMTRYGLSAAYAAMALAGLLLLVVAIFVVDHPPSPDIAAEEVQTAAADSGVTNRDLLRSRRFWGIVLAFAVLAMSASVMSAHVVPMVIGWGIDAPRAAALLSVSSIGGMAGSATWGWIAERLGGARVLALLCLSGVLLWVLLALEPSYPLLATIAGLMGFTTAPMVPVSSLAFSQAFGREAFTRAYGLCNLLCFPALVLGVPLAAAIYVATGGYLGAMYLMAALGVIGALAALISARGFGAGAIARQEQPLF